MHDAILLLLDSLVITLFIQSLFRKKYYFRICFFFCILFGFSFYRIEYENAIIPVIGNLVFELLPLIIISLLIYLLFKASVTTSIATGLFVNIIIIIVQIVSFLCVSLILTMFNVKLGIERQTQAVQYIYMLIMIVISYFMSRDRSHFFEKFMNYFENKTKPYVKYYKFMITIFLILIFILLGIEIYDNNGISNESFMLVCFTILLVFTIILLTYYETVINNCKNKQIEERNSLNEIHQDFVQNINYFGHSYNNTMQAINFFVNCEDLKVEDVRAVLKDLLSWNEENKINYKLKYINIPNPIVASILSIKQDYAKDLDVILDVAYEGECSVCINSKVFIDILNIVIDNAIEVAHYADDKTVYIKMEFASDEFIFRTKNNKAYKNNKLLKYGNSKCIGLKNINDLVKQNNKICYNINDCESTYEIIVIIKNDKCK